MGPSAPFCESTPADTVLARPSRVVHARCALLFGASKRRNHNSLGLRMSPTSTIVVEADVQPVHARIHLETVTVGQPRETIELEDAASHAPAQETEDTTAYLTGSKLWLTLISLIMVALAKGLDTTIVAVTVPSLTDQFKTVNDIGWYSAAAGLSLSASTFFVGKVYSVFPLKGVFLSSVILFMLASLLCTIAPTSATFVLGRALSGIASSGIGNGAVTLLSRLFPLSKRPFWFGICGAVQSVALVSAPLIGGALIDGFSWRACFGINLPISAAAIVVIFLCFHNPLPLSAEQRSLSFWEKLKKLDLIGTLFIVPAITCLLLALQWGGTRYGWDNAIVASLLVVFGVLVAGFSYLQYRLGDAATLPPRILKSRSVIGGAWFQACCDGTLAVTEFYISIYLQGVRGFSAAKSGALGLPMIVGLVIATLVAGMGTSAVGYYTPFMLATTIIAPVPAGVLTTLNIHESVAKVVVCLGILGFGIGLGMGGPFMACQAVLQPADIPIGNAITTFGGGLGVSLFISASSALFQKRLEDELQRYAPSVNATLLENAGLTDIRKLVGADRLRDVLLGYDAATTQTLYLPVALAVTSLIGSAAMEWKSVKQKTS